MREHEIPLYTLESKRPLASFDMIGVSRLRDSLHQHTQYARPGRDPCPLGDRDETHPVIIAGGHSTMNPEPMHAFIGAFVIGEGEEVIHDIIDALQAFRVRERMKIVTSFIFLHWRCAGPSSCLAKIQGVYVPRFYRPIIWKTARSRTSSRPSRMSPGSSPSASSRSCLPHRRSSSSPILILSTTASRWRSCVDARAAAASAMQG